MCFAIVPKDEKAKVEEVPTKVVNLLEEFPDIVLDNVLDGLPPSVGFDSRSQFSKQGNA